MKYLYLSIIVFTLNCYQWKQIGNAQPISFSTKNDFVDFILGNDIIITNNNNKLNIFNFRIKKYICTIHLKNRNKFILSDDKIFIIEYDDYFYNLYNISIDNCNRHNIINNDPNEIKLYKYKNKLLIEIITYDINKINYTISDLFLWNMQLNKFEVVSENIENRSNIVISENNIIIQFNNTVQIIGLYDKLNIKIDNIYFLDISKNIVLTTIDLKKINILNFDSMYNQEIDLKYSENIYDSKLLFSLQKIISVGGNKLSVYDLNSKLISTEEQLPGTATDIITVLNDKFSIISFASGSIYYIIDNIKEEIVYSFKTDLNSTMFLNPNEESIILIEKNLKLQETNLICYGIKSGIEKFKIKNKNLIKKFEYSPDGYFFAIEKNDTTIDIINSETGKLITTINKNM